MEKRLLLFLMLCFLMVFIYGQFLPQPKKQPAKPAPAEGTGSLVPEPQDGTASGTVEDGTAQPVVNEGPDATGPQDHEAGEEHTVETRRIRWVLDSWGGVKRALLKEYTREPEQDLADPESWYPVLSDRYSDGSPIEGQRPRSLTLELLRDDGTVDERLNLDRVVWAPVKTTETGAVYRLTLPDAGVVLTKEYLFPEQAEGVEGGALHLTMKLSLAVTDPVRAARYGKKGWKVRLRGPSGMPVERFAVGKPLVAAAFVSDRVSAEEFSPPRKWTKPGEYYPEEEEQSAERLVEWSGVHSRFFTVILRPMDATRVRSRAAYFEPHRGVKDKGEAFTTLAACLDFTLPLPDPGKSVSRGFLLYAGPMERDLFRSEAYGNFSTIISYGFFGPIVRVLVALLGLIRSVVGNWGLAIIILTLLVRMALFPLSRRSQLGMQRYGKKMARLKPKMEALKAKHAKNKKKMQEELMKLYREEGVRPPLGCLIMLLQLPIFIGLYQALRFSIGLRHSDFLWARDLTAPEQLVLLAQNHGVPLLWDPFYLNIFPILMGVTWYLSTALQPKPADPQQAQTMKMMKWFPVIFTLFLYNFPAGLALYMVVSSSWSIFETKVVKRLLDRPEEEPAAAGGKAFRKGK